MMRFELGWEEPDPKRARNSAATIAASYIVGGLVPLSSYMLVDNLQTALLASVVVTLIALFFFGYFKGRLTGVSPIGGGLRTVIIGGLASAATPRLPHRTGRARRPRGSPLSPAASTSRSAPQRFRPYHPPGAIHR